jgi:O-antigen ligase
MSPQTGVSRKPIRSFPPFGGSPSARAQVSQANAESQGATMAFWACAASTALLIGMPFVLFAMGDKKINWFWRILCIPLLGVLLVSALKTGSRGGLIAIVALIAFGFIRASAAGKLQVLGAALCLVVPSDLRTRYMTIFKTDRTASTTQAADAARDSSNARRGLIENAFILTFRRPAFGVGLAQFSPQSFDLFVARGLTGMWFTCHGLKQQTVQAAT